MGSPSFGVAPILHRSVAEGDLDPDAETVFINSGDGLKTLDAIQDHVGPKATVAASAKAVREALGI